MSAGVATAVLPVAADAETEGISCHQYAGKIADAMTAEHGGIWRVSIGNDFVLISKQLVSPSSTRL
jgi:hypothetical protein